MKLGIGSDHAGLEYKTEIKAYIEEKYGYEVVDYGTYDKSSTNYAIWGEKVANAVATKEVEKGILICGTGVGISLAANKVNGIRCATCSEPTTARLTRQHNDSNMLAFGARIVGIETAKDIVDAWLTATFEGGRHAERVNSLTDIENRQKK
mgnify:FL=1